MISLFDTARRQVVPLHFRDEGKVSLYACGPTVYGPPHIGHGRMMLTYDLLRRYLEWNGLEVVHASNITDVDDKIISKAAEEGITEKELADRYEAVWWDSMDRLNILRPQFTPHATDFIPQMIELIEKLIASGNAYETADGVYLDVAKIDSYGTLINQSIEDLRSGARVEVDENKKSPIDFVLWKKVDIEGQLKWDSPWGIGRPGWNTECVVMSIDILGDDFDIHSGGIDLAFPHHENERAQAVALGKKFCRYWMHNGFVEVDGEKMSKSLGNFTTLPDLLDNSDPRAYRLSVLQAHYRAPMEVTRETIAAAQAGVSRLDDFVRRAASLSGGIAIEEELTKFRACMDDDLDTPGATALLFELVRRGNIAIDSSDPSAADIAATVGEIMSTVGIESDSSDAEVDDATIDLMQQRDEARANKDFARADAIRAELVALGWTVEDGAEGTRVHR